MKFSEYKYERPNLEELKAKFESALKVIKESNSLDELVKTIDEINKIKGDVDTALTLCSIRYSINTMMSSMKRNKNF